jgi:hypothetical protein
MGVVLWTLFVSAEISSAQQAPDFSGSYLLTSAKGTASRPKTLPVKHLKVRQEGRVLEVVVKWDGEEAKSVYFLDGSESLNLTPGGAKSKDTARFKGKALEIESIVDVPQSFSPSLICTKEKWQFSGDLGTLTIRTRADSIIRVAGPGSTITIELASFVETYTRRN